MSRCLHITILEPSAAAPRGGKTYLAPRTGFDPEANTVMPQTDDPESNTVMPQTDDPEANTVMPQTDDPDQTGFLAGGQGGYGAAVAAVCSCCCAGSAGQTKAASENAATPNPFVTPRDYSGFVIVRMAAGVEHPDADSLWALAMLQTPPLTGLTAVLEMAIESGTAAAQAEKRAFETKDLLPPPPGTLVSRPLVELQGGEGRSRRPLGPCETFGVLRGLEKEAAATPFPPLHSLTAYWRLDLRKRPDLLEKVMEGLNRLAEVDLAYRELNAADPGAQVAAGELFIEDQGYLADAPVGIGAFWAWKSLAEIKSTKTPVTLCDLEQGWTTDHLDLKSLVPYSPFCGDNRAPGEGNPGHHGTAVLGQLAATGLVKGAAADLGKFVLASHYKSKDAKEMVQGQSVPHPFAGTNGHVAAAIAQLLDKSYGTLQEGAILLLEVQRALLPTEVDEADFDAIRLASALGVIVVEAAGNGGFDLDGYTDPDTRRTLRRGASGFRDSGAVFVGAARASLPHDRAPFSNYGSRLDCFGWGETVTTTGYGDLAGSVDTDFYTNAFSGTSSAAPIVAGAAALVQALHKDQTRYWLQPREMRDLLSDPATGTRQGPNVPGFIGVMPDLKAVLRGRLQLVPDVYMRRHAGDDGSAPGLDEEISSSPDILLWNGKGKETPAERFGEGPRSNTPAPGTPIDPASPESIYPNNLYVRLRNRGVGTGEAKVQIFASPAATLITPERWMPVGRIDVPKTPGGIIQGDILTVSQALGINLPKPGQWPQNPMEWLNAAVPFYSFLAVQLPLEGPSPDLAPGFERTVMLPPGPPYFQWDQFRSFLRGPGVAWRNIHPVQTNAASPITLSFLIAGTPDRTRHFDFEVIQRLPAEAEVTLAVHPALAAKLRQRQPWLANVSGSPNKLSLPHRPRTTLSRVALSPGVYAHAAFEVNLKPGKLLKGHSLAIRQLWRGEEVGRITWWFVDE